jgi:hypothetical protein
MQLTAVAIGYLLTHGTEINIPGIENNRSKEMDHRVLIMVRILTILGMLGIPSSSLSLAQGQVRSTVTMDASNLDGLVVVQAQYGSCNYMRLLIVDSTPDREGNYSCASNTNSPLVVGQGDGVAAQLTVRNTSNQSMTIKGLRAGGRGPGARARNWDAPNVDFPLESDIVLQPGQEHEYYLSRDFSSDGDYFAEPVAQDSNGQWHGISPYPRVWFNVGNAPIPQPPPAPPTPTPVPTATPVPGSGAQLKITGLSWPIPPAAYLPATLTITGQAHGLPTGSGYLVNLLVYMPFSLETPLSKWWNSADAAASKYISPATLPDGSFQIQIADITLPRAANVRYAVQVFSTADPNALDARPNEHMDIGPSDAEVMACWYAFFTIGWDTVTAKLQHQILRSFDITVVKPQDLIDATSRLSHMAKLDMNTFDAMDQARRCNGEPQCLNDQRYQWEQTQTTEGADLTVELTGGQLGAMALAAEAVIKAVPQLESCAEFVVTQYATLIKEDWRQLAALKNIIVQKVSAIFVHSPAYPLIVDSSGRRAGFLPDGTPVQEIPNSLALAVGDKRLVIAPSTSTQAQLAGYAEGTMSVETFLTGDANSGTPVSAQYSNVPVSTGLAATVISGDPEASMKIDTNHDGTVDQSRAPDSLEVMRPDDSYSFSQTGFTVSGRLWQIWQGGRSFDDSLYINGFPLTGLQPEVNATDGKTYQTQWFERARFEQHPENPAPSDVLLGLLGVNAAKGRQNETAFKPVGAPAGGLAWFKETQHTLGDASEGGQAIARYWNDLGGLPQFGFPLSEPFMEKSKDDGKMYLVQYFERQRFEYHPENAGTRYQVLLGRLGAEQVNGPSLVDVPIVYGPQSSTLETEVAHSLDTITAIHGLRLTDFGAEVKFYNPSPTPSQGPWGYGISFRSSGGSAGAFYVRSVAGNAGPAQIVYERREGNQAANSDTTGAPSIDLSPGHSNNLMVVVQADVASFYVNGQLVKSVSVAGLPAGDVAQSVSSTEEKVNYR